MLKYENFKFSLKSGLKSPIIINFSDLRSGKFLYSVFFIRRAPSQESRDITFVTRYTVRVANQLSTMHHQVNGVPQSSSLSGTLFVITINKVVSIIPFPLKTILFANGLSIHLQSNNHPHTHILLPQTTITTIHNWFTQHILHISFTKTHFMVFQQQKPKTPFHSLLPQHKYYSPSRNN